MLKVVFLRHGSMVVMCLVEKGVRFLGPNFECKKINGGHSNDFHQNVVHIYF